MKNILPFLLCFCISCHINAQQKKSETLLGVQMSIAPLAPMKTKIPTFKLGVQSFSYSTSLENRLSLRKKLNFSLQYSLNYTRIRAINSNASSNLFSTNVSAAGIYNLKQDVQVVVGGGVQKPLSLSTMPAARTIPSALIQHKSNGKYSLKQLNNLNPYFIIGLENSTKLFNKNLIYSLQYNFGFTPSKYKVIEESTTETERNQGSVQIGLKYKY